MRVLCVSRSAAAEVVVAQMEWILLDRPLDHFSRLFQVRLLEYLQRSEQVQQSEQVSMLAAVEESG